MGDSVSPHVQGHSGPNTDQAILLGLFDKYEQQKPELNPEKAPEAPKIAAECHKCEECDFTAKTQPELTSHVDSTHRYSSNKEYTCENEKCIYRSYNKAHYDKHVLKHVECQPAVNSNPEPTWMKCPHCNYETNVKQALTKHLKWHSGQSVNNATVNNAAVNSQSVNNNNGKNDINDRPLAKDNKMAWHQCPQCTYRSTNLGFYQHHMESHNTKDSSTIDVKEKPLEEKPMEEKPKEHLFKCDHCPYTVSYKPALQRHLNKIHPNSDKRINTITSYKCTKCSYKTINKGSYKRHVGMHKQGLVDSSSSEEDLDSFQLTFDDKSEDDEVQDLDETVKRFKCDQCEYSVGFEPAFKMHLKSHDKGEIRIKTSPKTSNSDEMTPFKRAKRILSSSSEDTFVIKGEVPAKKPEVPVQKFECTHCDYHTGFKPAFELHLKTHKVVKEEPEAKPLTYFKCDKCYYQTGFEKAFELHKKSHKDAEATVKSEEEPMEEDEEVLEDVVKEKKKKKPHKDREYVSRRRQTLRCPLCPYQTSYRATYSRHCNQHKRSKEFSDKKIVQNDEMYSCGHCEFHTKDTAAFGLHSLSHMDANGRIGNAEKLREIEEKKQKAQKVDLMLRCDRCNYKTSSKVALVQHKNRHPNHKRPVGRPKMTNSQVSELSFSKVSNSEPSTSKLSNSELSTSKISNSQLSTSNMSPGPSSEQMYTCYKCDFQTSHRGPMTNHERSHVTSRLKVPLTPNNHIRCTKCPYSSPLKAGVVNHMRLKHGIAPKKPILRPKRPAEKPAEEFYKCPHCTYSTQQKNYMDVHVKTIHGQGKRVEPCVKPENDVKPQVAVDEVRKFQCDQCDYRTKYESVLELHKKEEHEARKPDVSDDEEGKFTRLYCCNLCGNRTKLREDAVKHFAEEHEFDSNEVKFRCDLCDYTCKQKNSFLSHMQKRHKSKKNFKGYECGECVFRTIYFKNYVKHKKNVHGKEYNGKIYRCNKCDFVTLHFKSFQTHKETIHYD